MLLYANQHLSATEISGWIGFSDMSGFGDPSYRSKCPYRLIGSHFVVMAATPKPDLSLPPSCRNVGIDGHQLALPR